MEKILKEAKQLAEAVSIPDVRVRSEQEYFMKFNHFIKLGFDLVNNYANHPEAQYEVAYDLNTNEVVGFYNYAAHHGEFGRSAKFTINAKELEKYF